MKSIQYVMSRGVRLPASIAIIDIQLCATSIG